MHPTYREILQRLVHSNVALVVDKKRGLIRYENSSDRVSQSLFAGLKSLGYIASTGDEDDLSFDWYEPTEKGRAALD